MTNFKFRLGKVLDHKRTIEDYKKGEYGLAKKKLDDEKDRLYTFNCHKESIMIEMGLTSANTKVGSLAMYNNYIEDITRRIQKQEQVVHKVKEELEMVKGEMIIAVQEKKVFEKLKEKDYEEYLSKIERIEERQVDALVTYKTSVR